MPRPQRTLIFVPPLRLRVGHGLLGLVWVLLLASVVGPTDASWSIFLSHLVACLGIAVASVATHEAAHALTATALRLRAFTVYIGFGPPLLERRLGATRVVLQNVPVWWSHRFSPAPPNTGSVCASL